MAEDQRTDSDLLFNFIPREILSRRHQSAAASITAACLCVLLLSWLLELSRRGKMIDIDRPFDPPVVEFKIDINSAEWAELTLLPDISETMARRVVAYRESHGPFSSLEELQQVKGIGPRTLAGMKPWLFPIAPINTTAERSQ